MQGPRGNHRQLRIQFFCQIIYALLIAIYNVSFWIFMLASFQPVPYCENQNNNKGDNI